ncbi:MAG: radical SAM protein [Nitrososphaeria archaeon]
MNRDFKILLLNLPSPPDQRLWRDTAGGFGTAISRSPKYKAPEETPLHPFLPYACSLLLEANYEFKILDYQRLKMNKFQIIADIKKENPDVIFSILSLPSLKHDISLLNSIKKLMHNVIIVGVGTVCRVIPDEILQSSKIDILLRSSYPYIFNMIKLIEFITQPRKNIENISFRKNEKIIHTTNASEPGIESLLTPCYEYLQLNGYEKLTNTDGERCFYVPILESKGCPYNCIYCPYPLGFGEKIMFRSPKTIVDEMEHLHSIHGIKGFLLRGQTFAYNRRRAVKICEEIIQRKLDALWFCESRVDEVSKELLIKMKRSGCVRIHYGVETGDPELLKIAKPGVKLETTERAFRMTKEAGIMTQAHIILGWPNETCQTLERTRKLVLKLNPDEINLNFLTPYPGTSLYEIAKRNDLLLTTDWAQYTSHTVIMKTKNLTSSDLYKSREKIIRDFSKQKLKNLILDTHMYKTPYYLLTLTKKLVNRIIFPQA